MTLFRTVRVSSGLVLAFFSGAAQAQQNAGAAGKMATLQMPAIPDPAVEPVLAALMRAGGDRFRGIRNGAAWDADTSLLNPANPAPPGLADESKGRRIW